MILLNFFTEGRKLRVLCINDVSCIGKCSLTVALPVISACGVTCDVLPTALLSTHTGGFKGYTFHDLTGEIPAILKHWKSLDVKFDFIYSGYLGSIEQIDTVEKIKNSFLAEGGKFIVDPVMGDGGKLYDRFDDAFVDKMRELCTQAHYILPNLTEACFLARHPYPHQESADGYALVKKLLDVNPCPIVTGVHEEKEISVFYAENGIINRITSSLCEGFFVGAGDLFASAFVGCLARGKSARDAVSLATSLTTAAIKRSAKEVPDKRFGLNFEKELFPFLQELNDAED